MLKILVIWLSLQNAFSQSSSPSTTILDELFAFNKVSGLYYYSLLSVFNGSTQEMGLPETATINTINSTHQEQQNDLISLSRMMLRHGTIVALGNHINRNSHFDLYMQPVLDVDHLEPTAIMGQVQQGDPNEVGRFYFLTHDAVHIAIGIPRVQSSDLRDLEKTKKRIVQLMLRIESVASAWSLFYYNKWYWNWKQAQKGELTEEFLALNRGVGSVGNMSPSDIMDIVLANSTGKIWDYYRGLQRTIDYEQYRKAREAGVPFVFEDVRKKLTPFGEKMVIKYGMAPLVAIGNYFHPTSGYQAFIKYAQKQAEFYTTPWRVEWMELFNIGTPLDQLEKSVEDHIEQARKGIFFEKTPSVSQEKYELTILKNEVEQLGRKLIELKHFYKHYFPKNLDVSRSIDYFLENCIQFHKNLTREIINPQASSTHLWFSRYKRLIESFEGKLPIEQLIPQRYRLGHTEYRGFWRNRFAVVMPHDPELGKIVSSQKIGEEALRLRLQLEMPKSTYDLDTVMASHETFDFMKRWAIFYNQSGRKKELYAQDFLEALRFQFQDVLTPMLQEYSHLSFDERVQLISTAEKQMAAFLEKANSLTFSSNLEKDWNQDLEFKKQITLAHFTWADILDQLDQKKPLHSIQPLLDRIQSITNSVNSNKTPNIRLRDYFYLTESKTFGQKVSAFCSYIRGRCLRSDFDEELPTLNEKLLDLVDRTPRAFKAVQPYLTVDQFISKLREQYQLSKQQISCESLF